MSGINIQARTAGEYSARAAFSVTPSDTVDLPFATRALTLGVAGDIRVIFMDDNTLTPVTIPGRLAGVDYPYRIRRVMATGTTALGLVGLT